MNGITKSTSVPFFSLFTTEEAELAGFGQHQLSQWQKVGAVQRVAQGVYLPTSISPPRAAIRRANFDGCYISSFVVSGQKHGLWLPNHLPQPLLNSLRRDRVHGQHAEVVGNLLVTNLAWTAVNLARYQSIPNALIPIDCALRLGADRDHLMDLAESMKRWRGIGNVGEAICWGSPLSGSPLESGARGKFKLSGLPDPELQYRVTVKGRTYFADFAWPDCRVIVETDGKGKYEEPGAYSREKDRERDLQSLGWIVMRCGWQEIWQPDSPFLERLKRLIISSRRRGLMVD